jgi:hypothetical protein
MKDHAPAPAIDVATVFPAWKIPHGTAVPQLAQWLYP